MSFSLRKEIQIDIYELIQKDEGDTLLKPSTIYYNINTK